MILINIYKIFIECCMLSGNNHFEYILMSSLLFVLLAEKMLFYIRVYNFSFSLTAEVPFFGKILRRSGRFSWVLSLPEWVAAVVKQELTCVSART